ncbi:MAG: hypothetical protein V4683_00625 [Bacteroidota bacterium]
MKLINYIKFIALTGLMSNCVSQSQYKASVDNTKRLELLIEKERQENDQLNASRSVYEAQIQSLNNQIQKLQNEKVSINESFNASLLKSKDDKSKLETKIKALEGTILQQTENNRLTVEALGDKINNLSDDKRELINEKYKAKKKVSKKKKRRR